MTDELAKAVEGLTYRSELDEPWHAFAWPAGPGDAVEQVRRHAGKPAKAVPVDAWFTELADGDDAGRYAELRATLGRLLAGLSVVRAGEGPEVGVYVLGRAADGAWASVRTVSVET